MKKFAIEITPGVESSSEGIVGTFDEMQRTFNLFSHFLEVGNIPTFRETDNGHIIVRTVNGSTLTFKEYIE